jgi:hypothetical protein
MSQLDDAVVRYNKLLETGAFRDPAWVDALHQRMEAAKLSSGGRLICPFLRPNFISRRQFDSLVKTGESLICAIDRMEQMVLANPALLARLDLLPAEKMLASIDPGYQALEVAARLTRTSTTAACISSSTTPIRFPAAGMPTAGRPVLRRASGQGIRKKYSLEDRQPQAPAAALLNVHSSAGRRSQTSRLSSSAAVRLRAKYELYRDYFRE